MTASRLHPFCGLAAALCLFASLASAQSTATPPRPSMQDLLPAILPVSRLDQPWWAQRHQHIVDLLRTRPDINLLLIGDSIIQNYDKATPPDENFLPTWQQFYAPRRALNLGFSGDTTANVLWRLTHGELDNLRPAVAILLIGTNNTGQAHQTAEQTIAGIDNIIGTLAQRLPQTRILLLGILPSDLTPEKTAADKAVNACLAKRYGNRTADPATPHTDIAHRHSETAERTGEPPPSEAASQPSAPNQTCTSPHPRPDEESRITYLDLSSTFLHPDGTLNAAIFYDPRLKSPGKPLHPDTEGQRRMAEAIEPTLSKLLNDTPRTAKK